MGATTLQILDQSSLAKITEEQLLFLADSLWLQDNYKVGEKERKTKIDFLTLTHNLLCQERCEISEYLKDKLEYKFEKDCKIKEKKHKKDCEKIEHCNIEECSSLGTIQW